MQTLARPAGHDVVPTGRASNLDRRTVDVRATAYEAQLCCDQDSEVVIT